MGDEGTYGKSEWNEQVYYATLYFTRTSHCRTYQEEGNLSYWKASLEAKMSIVLGVLSPEEQKLIYSWRNKVLQAFYDYSMISNNKYAAGQKAIERANLNNVLFEVEGKVDTLANLHMPFLKTTKTYDITDF